MITIFFYSAEQLTKLFQETLVKVDQVVTLANSYQREFVTAGHRLTAQPILGMSIRDFLGSLHRVRTCKASISAEIRIAILHGMGSFDNFVVVTTSEVEKHALAGSRLPVEQITFVDIKNTEASALSFAPSSRTLLIVAVSPGAANWAVDVSVAGYEDVDLLAAARHVCAAVEIAAALVFVEERVWDRCGAWPSKLDSDLTRLQLASMPSQAECLYRLLNLQFDGACQCSACRRDTGMVAVPVFTLFALLWPPGPLADQLSYKLEELIGLLSGKNCSRRVERCRQSVLDVCIALAADCEQLAACFHAHVLARKLNVNKLTAALFEGVCLSVPALAAAVPVAAAAVPALAAAAAHKPRPQLTCPIDNDATRRACAVIQTIVSVHGMAEAASLHSNDCTSIDCIVCHLRADSACGRSQLKISSTVANLRCDGGARGILFL